MADIKNRDGSVIIYGPMQANTELGYAAYSDGIAHEKANGEVVRLNEFLDDLQVPAIVVDNTLSQTSTNPVENNVITNALGQKQNKLTAGTNITIDENNVISAAGGSDSTYVEANIEITGGESKLTSLQVGTEKYIIEEYDDTELTSLINSEKARAIDAENTLTTDLAETKVTVNNQGTSINNLDLRISALEEQEDSNSGLSEAVKQKLYVDYFIEGARIICVDPSSNPAGEIDEITITTTPPGVLTSADYSTLMEYFRTEIFNLGSVGASIVGLQGARGRFLVNGAQASGSSFYSLLSSICNLCNNDFAESDIDSFVAEAVGAPGSAAECTLIIDIYTKDAKTYRIQICSTFNSSDGATAYKYNYLNINSLSSYDDTELRQLIATNETSIESLEDRIDTLEGKVSTLESAGSTGGSIVYTAGDGIEIDNAIINARYIQSKMLTTGNIDQYCGIKASTWIDDEGALHSKPIYYQYGSGKGEETEYQIVTYSENSNGIGFEVDSDGYLYFTK